MKLCSKCGVLTTRFGVATKNRDGLRSQCKDCDSADSRKHRKENPDAHLGYKLKERYGISLDEYNYMLLEQGGTCAMCPATALDEVMCVDHNHATGDVRAILCKPCNTMLGMAKDSTERLQAGIDYLEEHGSYESDI